MLRLPPTMLMAPETEAELLEKMESTTVTLEPSLAAIPPAPDPGQQFISFASSSSGLDHSAAGPAGLLSWHVLQRPPMLHSAMPALLVALQVPPQAAVRQEC